MLTVIQHHAVQVDFVVDAAQLMASSIEDEKIDGHDDVVEGASCDRPPGCGIEMVDNDGEVEVAVGAEVAAGAGAEGDDLEGVGGCDDALDCGENLLLGDADVELGGRGGHAGSLYLGARAAG